ncbi:hypothetical protein E2C01_093174 [Portunus trituberculatus]|uniref:RNase H type-1 domain-containing protein n=1 Tax=Portunus trituberculatus TaxID=210409 RepID=A0A5B7JXX6_PORTR|nr:hypothetical protein [Portunus trituberculatus]
MDSDSREGSLTPLYHDPRKILGVLTSIGVAEACINIVMSPLQPAWNSHCVGVDIHFLHQPKRDWLPHELQDMFMTKLSKYPHILAIHVYCDGSVNGSMSTCGLFIRDYISANNYTDTEVSSQTALYALQSTSPMDCDLVSKCLDFIHALEGAGAAVHFTWIPSHVGILLNEKADCLAQCALQDDTVDLGTEYTLGYVKNSIKDFVYIVALVISWSFVATGAVALVFIMHVSLRAVLTPMGNTLHHTTGWQ